MKWQDSDKIRGRSIGKGLVSLAIPAVTSTLFIFVFEVIDMFWVAKLGSEDIAALSGASFFIWMVRGLGLTIATGTIALVARRTGERDEEGLMTTIPESITSSFLFAVFIMILLLLPVLHVFEWFLPSVTEAGLAEQYSIVFLAGLIFVYMMMTAEFIVRGIGDTRTPMIIAGTALFLNAVLDPVFIFNLKMGLKGAAYATILAQFIGAILMLLVVFRKVSYLRSMKFSFGFFFSRTFVKKFYTIVKIGGPVGLSDAGFSLIYLVLAGIISIFGKEPLAALGIAHRLEAMPFFICLGFSMAVEPMVGQFLGARKIESARKSVYLALKITVGMMALISLFYFFMSPVLFRVFFTDDPAIISHGVHYMRTVVLFDVFLALEIVLTGAFSGAGDTKPPFLIVFPITFARIPLAYLFGVVLNLGVTAIWGAIAFTAILKGLLLFFLFRKDRWIKKNI
jgi:putative MATE family efflux protein